MVLLRHGWRAGGRFFLLTRTWGDAAHWRAAVGNARCAAVGEASEASRDADVTVAHAHAQRHGCLSARWAQTCAPRAEGHGASQIDERKVVFRSITLNARVLTKQLGTKRA